jgi:F0F1-type ATP synthase assembly protein I
LARRHPGWLFLVLCTASSIAFTAYESQGYADLLLAVPFMALITGIALGSLVDRFSRAESRPAGGILLVAIAVGLGALIVSRPAALRRDVTLQEQMRLSQEVLRFREQGRSVYAIGCTHLLAMVGEDNWCKYGFFFRRMDPYLAAHRLGLPWEAATERPGPDVVLASRYLPRGAPEWLQENYRRMDAGAFAAQGIEVWQRRGLEDADVAP